MNSRRCLAGIYVSMIEAGEDVSVEEIVRRTNDLFRAGGRTDEPLILFYLGQVRQHLQFLRDPSVDSPPTVRDLLLWLVSAKPKSRERDPDILVIRGMLEYGQWPEEKDVRKSDTAQSGAASFPQTGVHAH